MTGGCDLANHPRACVIAQTRYARPECKSCATGEKNLRAQAGEPGRPPADSNKDLTEKKEAAPVPTKKDPKEKILGLIERAHADGKAITSSLMMQRCALTSSAARAAVEELLSAGKIREWHGPRNATLYTLPDAPNPFPAGEASAKVPVSRPQTREKKKKPAATPQKPITPRPKEEPASGKTAIAAVIECLKSQRERIDIAIEALEGIA